jgi:hypothetical protein
MHLEIVKKFLSVKCFSHDLVEGMVRARRLSAARVSEAFSHFVTSMTAPVASGWSVAGWGLHPLESAAFPRRTPQADSCTAANGRTFHDEKLPVFRSVAYLPFHAVSSPVVTGRRGFVLGLTNQAREAAKQEARMMPFPMRASYLVFALVIAGSASAQQSPTATSPHTTMRLAKAAPKQGGEPAGYLKYCGADFGCYTGIPLRCASNTRPYQNIAAHQCFCLPDGCPQ